MRTWLVILTLTFGLVKATLAQPYPSGPIRLIVPFSAGGSADAIARPMAEKLSKELQQPVVVDNRPGGLTVIGADRVAKSPSDGYTLFLMPGTHVLTPYLVKSVPFNPIADFTPVALVGTQAFVLSANSEQPYKNMDEMLKYAKANPGAVSLGVSEVNSLVIASMLQSLSGINFIVANFKGAGPLTSDLLGNQISLTLTTPTILPHVTSGKVRALAVSSRDRLAFLPETPTMAEIFTGSNFDVQTWYGVAGPADMPKDVVQKLHDALTKVLSTPDMKKRMTDIAIEIPSDTGPDALERQMNHYKDRMAPLLQAAGIKPQ